MLIDTVPYGSCRDTIPAQYHLNDPEGGRSSILKHLGSAQAWKMERKTGVMPSFGDTTTKLDGWPRFAKPQKQTYYFSIGQIPWLVKGH